MASRLALHACIPTWQQRGGVDGRRSSPHVDLSSSARRLQGRPTTAHGGWGGHGLRAHGRGEDAEEEVDDER